MSGILLAGWLCSVWAGAAEPPIAWEENFDSPACLQNANFYLWNRYGRFPHDESLVIQEFQDGVFKYGLKYREGRADDWLSLVYGNIVWGHQTWPEWGPFNLQEFPFVEIRWRGTPFELWYGKETAAGEKLQDYTYPPVVRQETDADGRAWNVTIFRTAADSSVPGAHTPVKLLGINPMITTPHDGQDAVIEIDYIRVRGFTEEEAQREANVIATLANFPPSRWRGRDDFFPFGVYGTGFLRGDFEWWGGDYEGAYATYSRNHCNYIAENYEIEIYRSGGPDLATEQWAAAVDRYLAEVAPLIESARANGLRCSEDIRWIMGKRDPGQGYQQIVPIVQRLAEAHADDDVIVSWFLADEPGVDRQIELVSIIRAVREADPLQRPALIVFNSPGKMGPYMPYLSLNFWDNYPVLEGHRNPWNVRPLTREYRHLLPDVPMWPVLQAFETRPPAREGDYVRPSDAEMRLMAYLALAEGAQGLVWFHGYGSGRDEHLVNRTGFPRGGMMATLADLGARLIPLGPQLLATAPREEAEIQVTQRVEPTDGEHVLTLSALQHRDRPLHYLVAINEDLDRPRSARVQLGREILAEAQGVYDLDSLDGNDLAEGGNFEVSTLAGGDGRFYVVCDEATYKQVRTEILGAKAREEVRVLQPDLTIARRWGLDLTEVEEALAACQELVDQGQAEAALEQAVRVKARLDEAMANDSELNATRRALSDLQVELAEVSPITEYYSLKPHWWTGRDHPMLVPNPAFLELSQRYWEVGRGYRDVYTRYLKGEKENLWGQINQVRQDGLKMREGVLAFLREKLQPTEEPSGEE